MSRAVSQLFFLAILGLLFPALARAQNINGTWHFDYGYDMTFTGSGGSFTGHGAGNGYTWPVTNGVISGNSVSWHESYDQITYTVDRVGTINGDSMSGTYTTGGGGGTGVPWSATRISGGGSPTPSPTPGSGKRPTKMSLFCNRTGVLLETADCSATVADAGPQPVSLPTGTITFAATNGFFPASGSCNPIQTPYSPGIGSCKAIFQIPNGFPLGAKFPIDATYGGDATFDPSSTSHKLIVASCVGTPAKPCKNSIGLDFPEVPQVIQDAIDALLLCGGGSKTPAAGSRVVSRVNLKDKVTCVVGALTEFDLAEALIGLTPDQFRFIASKISDKQANGNPALQNFKKLSTSLDDETLTRILDPNSLGNKNTNRVLSNALRKGKVSIFERALYLKGKKGIANPFISVGHIRVTLKGNSQKRVKFRLSKDAKALVAIFTSAGFKTLPIRIQVEATRSDSKKTSKKTGKAVVALN